MSDDNKDVSAEDIQKGIEEVGTRAVGEAKKHTDTRADELQEKLEAQSETIESMRAQMAAAPSGSSKESLSREAVDIGLARTLVNSLETRTGKAAPYELTEEQEAGVRSITLSGDTALQHDNYAGEIVKQVSHENKFMKHARNYGNVPLTSIYAPVQNGKSQVRVRGAGSAAHDDTGLSWAKRQLNFACYSTNVPMDREIIDWFAANGGLINFVKNDIVNETAHESSDDMAQKNSAIASGVTGFQATVDSVSIGSSNSVTATAADGTTGTASNRTVTYDSLVDLFTALPDQYDKDGAAWYFNRDTLGRILKLKDDNGQPLIALGDTRGLRDGESGFDGMLLGRPYSVMPGMASFGSASQQPISFGKLDQSFGYATKGGLEFLLNPYRQGNKGVIELTSFFYLASTVLNTDAMVSMKTGS